MANAANKIPISRAMIWMPPLPSTVFKRCTAFMDRYDATTAKIIATYRDRTSEDRYSRAVPISEIEENDFNLNIPRYVDTFVEEDAVNLAAVLSELKAINGQMKDVDAQIAAFCAELGLEAPL